MKEYFKTPVRSRAEAEQFYIKLERDDLLFHPEDSAGDIIEKSPCPSEGGPDAYVNTFTEEEAILVDERVDETWHYLADPCEFILKTFYPENL